MHQSARKMGVSRTGGQEEPCRQTHIYKFCLSLAVRTSLGSCETRVNVDHCLPRTPWWPQSFWSRSHRRVAALVPVPLALLVSDVHRAAELTWAAVWPENTRDVLQTGKKNQKNSQDLVHDVCKRFCVKTWGEDVYVACEHCSKLGRAGLWTCSAAGGDSSITSSCFPGIVCLIWFWFFFLFLFVLGGFWFFVYLFVWVFFVCLLQLFVVVCGFVVLQCFVVSLNWKLCFWNSLVWMN